jgi:hypothetical protein
MAMKFHDLTDFNFQDLNDEQKSFYNKLTRKLKFTNIKYINKIYQKYNIYEKIINNTNTIYKNILNNEKEDNKNKIIEKIFRNLQLTFEQKNMIKNNIFVEFPIDLIVETLDDINIKYLNPPIFNRCWCETDEKIICIFPFSERNILTNKPFELMETELFSRDTHPDFETQTIFAREILNIKSIINHSTPIEYLFFNTEKYHGKIHENTGGNIHCLLKQIFI